MKQVTVLFFNSSFIITLWFTLYLIEDGVHAEGLSKKNSGVGIVGYTCENIVPKSEIYATSSQIDEKKLEDLLKGITPITFDSLKEPVEFLLGLGRATCLKKIIVTFKDNQESNCDITIWKAEYSPQLNPAQRSAVLASVKGFSGKVWEHSVTIDEDVSFLDVQLQNNKKPLEIERVEILVTPPDEEQSILLSEENQEPFLSKDNPKNFLRYFGVSISKGFAKLAAKLIEGKNLTDHEKIVLFMQVSKNHKNGLLPQESPEKILLNRTGACGSWAALCIAFCNAVDIPARNINLYNFPKNSGHSVMEAFVNGRWQLYDPNFAVYYTTTPENTKNPYVLSFEELRSGKGNSSEVIRVVGLPERLRAGGNYAENLTGKSLVYLYAEPAGPIGPDFPMFFPLRMSPLEPIVEKKDFTFKCQGGDFIGKTYSNNNQKILFSDLDPNAIYTLSIHYSGFGGQEQCTVFPLEAIAHGATIVSGKEQNYAWGETNMTWVVTFKPKDTTCEIILKHNVLELSYLLVESYNLEKVSL